MTDQRTSRLQLRDAHRRLLVVAIILNVVALLFSGALMFTSGYMISLAATIPFTVLALHLPSIFVRIFGIGKPLIQYVERLLSHDWVLRMTSTLRKGVYDGLERTVVRTGIGTSLGIFAEDIEHIQNLYLRTVIPEATLLALYAIVVIAMGLFSPAMGLLLLVCMGIVCIVLPLVSLAVNRSRVMEEQELQQRAYALATERVMDVTDWRLSGRKNDWGQPLLAACAERERVRIALAKSLRRMAFMREVVCAIVICCVFLWAAFAFASTGVLDGLTGSGFFATGIADALSQVAMHDSVPYGANWIAAFVLCAFPIMEAFNSFDEAVLGHARHKAVRLDMDSLEEDASRGDGGYGPQRSVAPSDPNASIELDGVSFAYEGASGDVLAGISLSIPRGSRVAIIGRSGVGKTTLLDIMRGYLLPTEGAAVVAGNIGIIEQDPYIFHMPLRENLLLANPHATEGQIVDALAQVRLGSLLGRLPDGLDTVMAEDGSDISGGEKHRLALARILLHGSDIVLLDEPFQGLDERTAREVSDEVFEALEGRTLVVVTHDLDSLDRFDAVYELKDGGLYRS